VRVETLIFQEADYVDVACKETEEISAILASYDIFLNVMDL
jgi:small nuclear ribonucleoprotein (snRNP)-like protein